MQDQRAERYVKFAIFCKVQWTGQVGLQHTRAFPHARSWRVGLMPLFGSDVLMTSLSHVSATSESALYG
jgi:hypothetical protein